jgi:hypothetical protein
MDRIARSRCRYALKTGITTDTIGLLAEDSLMLIG